MIVLLVSLLGGLGAATRFVVDGWIRSRTTGGLPVATMAINVTGSLLIGFLAGGLASGALDPDAYVVAATGFCGGYTTFSTASMETVRLAQEGAYRRALVAGLGTLLLTVLAAAAGVGVATALL
ncbi:fluoride efflux transporter CrcB [Cellulomonas edaphi]|uniref:Fluoride-specific ion channel FluC n=1 Tax=Cellulomonas edaphi TaxID=3053468 RepID=A0ABT7S6J4_9CELL|nr:fluoride efflux transporter CrcB [Cellulomons edaphi]MDM7831129.1 fluoride efflux transporter CrcB [Cellulomons edaphi]